MPLNDLVPLSSFSPVFKGYGILNETSRELLEGLLKGGGVTGFFNDGKVIVSQLVFGKVEDDKGYEGNRGSHFSPVPGSTLLSFPSRSGVTRVGEGQPQQFWRSKKDGLNDIEGVVGGIVFS
jgi:hypothetical protein